ncbi:MAG TPA: hypothetical protein VNG51_23245 [Ktedonobacteraceae bacterium]|nr:hypothetical protein [Ktedonobacteraceae bacterium]
MISNEHYFDVCIVCALAEEAQAVLEVISRRCRVKFKKGFSARHNSEYRYTTIRNNMGEPVTIHISWLPDKGSLETALHFKPILEEFRPRFVAMTGICAGDKRKVKLGDLVIADRAFLFDTGKIMTAEDGRQVYLHNVKTYNADPSILQAARLFDEWRPFVAKLKRPASLHQQRDWLLNKLLEEATPQVEQIPLEEREKQAPHWRSIVQKLQEEPDAYLTAEWVLKDTSKVHQLRYGKEIFPFKDPQRPESYIAPMASSNAVRSDNPFKEVQLPIREAVAIDMEGAAFYRTLEEFPYVRSLLVKGVCDYANKDKDDTYHHYASVVSAVYALCFIQEYVTEERMPTSQGRLAFSRGSSSPSATTGRSRHASPLIENLSDNYVYRVHEFKALKASILRKGQQRLTAITSSLKGAGGYGKTTLAQALCHDSEIIAAFPDGIEWITLGEAPNTSDLVGEVPLAKAEGLLQPLLERVQEGFGSRW